MNLRLGVWIATVACLVSCGPSDRYWGVYDLPTGAVWLPTQNVVFEFTTMAGRGDQIELFVRTEAYTGQKPLRLVIQTARPDGLFWQDTVSIRPTPTWGSVYEAKAIIRRGVRWKNWETLSIGVRPADEPIEGVLGLGLAIDGAAAKKKE